MFSITEKMRSLNQFLDQCSAPVQTVDLAHHLGIKVFHADWPKDISGKIQKDLNGGASGYAIYVNENDPVNRRRFTTAHEIAHYILHQDKIGDGLFDDALYRSGLSNAIEVQANNLAADILMPWRLLNPAIQQLGADARELASFFQVSEQAMNIRIN